MARPSIFQYPPLEEHDSIRLLLLRKAPRKDNLEAELVQRPLSTIGDYQEDFYSYTALSYCWGLQDVRLPVFMGSDVLYTGQNLHDALHYLRKENTDVLIWVDGLCINQENVAERSRQVQMMRDIYSKASETVVFLGLPNGNTSLSAWNFLQRESSDPDLKAAKDREVHFRGELQDVELDVLSRPWFSRVWVLQEVVVSKNIKVQCGQVFVSWDDFCRTLLLSPRVSDRYGREMSHRLLYKYLLEMCSARAAFLKAHKQSNLMLPWYDEVGGTESGSDNILDMLSRARSLEATDPRDKIFALFGISSGIDSKVGPVVDYSLDVIVVYRNFTHYMVEYAQSYDILSYISPFASAIRFPSWVPDWRRGYGYNVSRNILSILPQESKEGSSSRQRLIKANHDWTDANSCAGRSLRCVGRVLATVIEVSDGIIIHADEELGFEKLRERHKDDPTETLKRAILEKWERFPWRRGNDTGWEINYLPPVDSSYPTPNIRDALRRDGIFPHIDSEKLDSFFVPGTFTSSTRPLDSRSIPTKPAGSRLKRVFRRKPTKPEHSTSTSVTTASHEVDILAHSLENQLFQRSRKTVQLSNFDSLSAAIITVDPSSVIDGRHFARCLENPRRTNSRKKRRKLGRIALVSAGAVPNDLIITLHGGRVAYVVRPSNPKFHRDDPPPKTLDCQIVGECLRLHPALWEANNLEQDTSFTFLDWPDAPRPPWTSAEQSS